MNRWAIFDRPYGTGDGKVKGTRFCFELVVAVFVPPCPEGAGVRPAQGNALGKVSHENIPRPNGPIVLPASGRAVGPFSIRRMRCVPQGVALGWVNGRPFGANGAAESATTTLVHDGVLSRSPTGNEWTCTGYPAMNRWAIVNRPYGTFRRTEDSSRIAQARYSLHLRRTGIA